MPAIRCLGVIPSRFPSTRLFGKPLKDIGGKTLVQRVWEQASKSRHVAKVVVATDDERIFSHAKSFGADAMMTGNHHHTGSDRVAEVMERLAEAGEQYDLVANIQGDMPFINPALIDKVIDVLAQSGKEFGMSTVATPIATEEEFLRPSAVKAVLANDGSALYFSRAPIPFWRDPQKVQVSEAEPAAYKHMGLYVFRPEALRRLTQLEQSLPEKREGLEQLRALCGGIRIKVAVAGADLTRPGIEVDTEGDLERAREAAKTFP